MPRTHHPSSDVRVDFDTAGNILLKCEECRIRLLGIEEGKICPECNKKFDVNKG